MINKGNSILAENIKKAERYEARSDEGEKTKHIGEELIKVGEQLKK